jgi:hypothetical protein
MTKKGLFRQAPQRNMPATADNRVLEVNTQRLHPSKIILCYVLCRNGKIG